MMNPWDGEPSSLFSESKGGTFSSSNGLILSKTLIVHLSIHGARLYVHADAKSDKCNKVAFSKFR